MFVVVKIAENHTVSAAKKKRRNGNMCGIAAIPAVIPAAGYAANAGKLTRRGVLLIEEVW